jgi:putative hydrolase of the HAD superfamily
MPRIQLAGIRVVVFDLDDTLYPERLFAWSGFEAVSDWLKQRLSCPFDPAERMRLLFDTEHRPRVFNQLLREMQVEVTDEMVSSMVDVYRNHQPRITLFEDAEQAITRWSGRFHLAMISDGVLAVQQNKVAALGLVARLEPLILTDTWGSTYWKPHPRAFQEIEKYWRARGSTCVYVADNPGKDFVAPRQLGWQTVQIRRPDGVHADVSPPTGGSADWQTETLDNIDITY